MNLRLYPIIPGLYQSAKTHDLSCIEKEVLVRKYKIDMVINLWHTADEEMAKLVKTGYIHRYMPDGKTPIFDELERIADIVAPLIRKGTIVLSHCYGGRNRSGLLNAMIVMRVFHCNGQIALEYIQQRRPNSLVNETFANWLMKQKEIT